MSAYKFAIHGGAGTIEKHMLSPEQELAYLNGLQSALEKGKTILSNGGTALDAVEQAVILLENNPLFNAGKGSVFNHEGKHEMDAAIMDGKNLKAGAVTCISNIRNPIELARKVMDESEHVLLSGAGAESFAKMKNMNFESDTYFHDEYRFDQWQEIKNTNKTQLDHTEKKFGTVGAVALDIHGNLTAATSTGGMTNKRWGRIGDTPIIGAGTYANNQTCAISCTGHGEFYMRAVVAYDISCLMEYKRLSLKEACDLVVMQKLVAIGGEGGLIAIDKYGNLELPFNSAGMYRGWCDDANMETAIYSE
ncbi:MAG: isoaspartyl peptidase/L-asparaginase [Bacteroidetes bacterium]|nr:isoaspartyl peptidase/L-asparaginase [Bacteroidota bacterium]